MRRPSVLSLSVVAVLALVAHADLSKIVRVDVASQQYIDAEGRSRHFHGTNMVNKKFPFHKDVTQFIPGRSIVDQDIQLLKDLNVNLVRLGVHWAGVEPERGSYNQTYLDITHGIITKLQDNGIYTLVDQHQDVWGAQICGHGAPVWFVKPDWVVTEHRMPVPQKLQPFAHVLDGIPSEADCNSIAWGTSYLTYAVANAFGRLYNNYDNLGDAWAAYWSVVATNYRALPGVMGYDLMNEPWVGDHMANPLLLIPGVADHENLEPLWNKGNSAIRKIDDTTIVFFEGVTYDILAGFNNVPGGDGSKTAQSYHFYNPPLGAQLGTIEDTIKNRITDANRLKTTGMLTEFRLWDQTDKGLASSLEITRQADRYLQSWTAWAYEELFEGTAGTDHWGPGPSDSGNPPAGTTVVQGEPYPALALIYARTYAEATAGITKSSRFEDFSGKYWVSWVANTRITAPGLIRIAPKSFYPDGIRVISNPRSAITYSMENENVVQLHYTDSAGPYNGKTILLSVQPLYPTGTITNPASGNKCIDVFGATVLPNNPIVLYTCGPRWNQDRKSGKYCLDTSPTGRFGVSFLNVVLNPCQEGSATQKWTTYSNGNIVNDATGFCVDINASEYKDGSKLLAYPCGQTQANQVWNLPQGVDGVWEVKP
ncbi:hypothetical protein ABW21_db0205750 [Orbilia brochopaga]|nr:hypothetical protein ABW21_db0205750 [Drechslerella brochopaga]